MKGRKIIGPIIISILLAGIIIALIVITGNENKNKGAYSGQINNGDSLYVLDLEQHFRG